MKWLSPLSLSLVLLIGLAHADEPAADKLVVCPACGAWQTSFATAPGMAGEIIVIDGARLIIPSCGIGVADFTLKRGRENLLSFQAWDMNRDDPCDAASARGSGACAMISKGLIYKALAAQAKAAYELATVITTPRNKSPSFNVGRFAATVARFCEHREKDSGAGAWPFAWLKRVNGRSWPVS
jgi:hypothetical protein